MGAEEAFKEAEALFVEAADIVAQKGDFEKQSFYKGLARLAAGLSGIATKCCCA